MLAKIVYPNSTQDRLYLGSESTMLRLALPSRLAQVSGFELSASHSLSLAKDNHRA